MLYLYNSLTEKKEIFIPIDKNLIKLYVCGPTVYDYIHIGNARAAVVYDLLFRVLIGIYDQNHVKYVRNITDVDDKINARAKSDNISITQLTQEMIRHYHDDLKYLNCIPPTIEPKATTHINEMIEIINILIEKNYAYVTNLGNVYFNVTKDINYGKLARQNISKLMDNVRNDALEDKINNLDFALWKTQTSEDPESALFKSPWGLGRPGWHIECSAMSHKHLGEVFDIHGGGVDLIFPHHNNEMAQSSCAFDIKKMANYWVHNGTLTVAKNKMSKSLGNFITVKNCREEKLDGQALRYFLLSANYHKPLDYSAKAISDASNSMNYLYNTLKLFPENIQESATIAFKNLPDEFRLALLDNLNTSKALAFLLNIAKQINKNPSSSNALDKLVILKSCGNFLGVLENRQDIINQDNTIIDEGIKLLLEARGNAKLQKNWPLADQIRLELHDLGIIVEDLPNGSYKIKKI